MKRQCEIGGVMRLASYKLIGGLVVKFRERGLHRGANRTASGNLAERAERTDTRVGVEVRSTMMRNLASYGVLLVVVKDFSGKKMKLGGEQRTHNQGMHPEPEPVFSPASHSADSVLHQD